MQHNAHFHAVWGVLHTPCHGKRTPAAVAQRLKRGMRNLSDVPARRALSEARQVPQMKTRRLRM